MDLDRVQVLWLLLLFALTLWLLLDAARRGRGWVRWQVLWYVVGFLAIPVWLFRRRRWPVSVEISRARQLRFAAIAVVIVALDVTLWPFLTTHYVQVARVDTLAMSPTLDRQDRLLVDKRLSNAGDPAVGDIVMMRYPLDPERSFVMRVIAAGGDEVRIVDGVVFRNGRRVEEPYVMEAYRGKAVWGPEVVPQDTYFVLGDSRTRSSDSLEWGFLPRENITGRVAVRWWPLSAWRRF